MWCHARVEALSIKRATVRINMLLIDSITYAIHPVPSYISVSQETGLLDRPTAITADEMIKCH
uniref:Uncharacterized protein n=1 Tax=Escherichia coli TaxID=562 RepID=A0A2S1J9D7_ECOLX|nr:hypothetical protein LHLDPJGA_00089 [Escherichia coli]